MGHVTHLPEWTWPCPLRGLRHPGELGVSAKVGCPRDEKGAPVKNAWLPTRLVTNSQHPSLRWHLVEKVAYLLVDVFVFLQLMHALGQLLIQLLRGHSLILREGVRRQRAKLSNL